MKLRNQPGVGQAPRRPRGSRRGGHQNRRECSATQVLDKRQLCCVRVKFRNAQVHDVHATARKLFIKSIAVDWVANPFLAQLYWHRQARCGARGVKLQQLQLWCRSFQGRRGVRVVCWAHLELAILPSLEYMVKCKSKNKPCSD